MNNFSPSTDTSVGTKEIHSPRSAISLYSNGCRVHEDY